MLFGQTVFILIVITLVNPEPHRQERNHRFESPHPIALDYLPFGTTYVGQFLASLRFEQRGKLDQLGIEMGTFD